MRDPQLVFASPIFIDHCDEHVMGLKLPTAGSGLKEHTVRAEPPVYMQRTGMRLDTEITVDKGKSLVVVMARIKRNEIPEPS